MFGAKIKHLAAIGPIIRIALPPILTRTMAGLLTGIGFFLRKITKGEEAEAGGIPRVAWADAVKGFVIVVVVLAHAAQYIDSAGYKTGFLRYLIGFVQPIGMPMFFMISGMFTGRHIDGSFPDFWKYRLRPLVWVLLVWVPIDWSLAAVFPTPDVPSHGKYLWQILTGYLFPTSYLWFIWSLAAYSLATHIIGKRHPWPWLILGLVVCLAMLGLTPWHYEKYGFRILAAHFSYHLAMTFFFFFYFGYIFRDRILAASRGPALPIMVASLVGYTILAYLSEPITGVAARAFTSMITISLGVFGAIYFGRVLALWPSAFRIFSQLGALSLPIYLLHPLIVMPIAYCLRVAGVTQLQGFGPLLAIGVAALAVGVAIGVTLLALRFGLTIFFAPPSRFGKERPALV